jgi:hypothetical protein
MNIVTYFKGLVEAFKEMLAFYEGTILVPFENIVEENDGVKIYYSTRTIRAITNNPSIWSLPITPLALPDSNEIVLPDREEWETYPIEVKAFLFHHELGHIKLHKNLVGNTQINFLKRLIIHLMGKVQQIEVEADKYSVSIVGKDKAIKALKWMYERSKSKENLRRIEIIQAY